MKMRSLLLEISGAKSKREMARSLARFVSMTPLRWHSFEFGMTRSGNRHLASFGRVHLDGKGPEHRAGFGRLAPMGQVEEYVAAHPGMPVLWMPEREGVVPEGEGMAIFEQLSDGSGARLECLLCCWNRSGLLGVVAVYRDTMAPPFSHEERRLLVDFLHPALEVALHRMREMSEIRARMQALRFALAKQMQPIVLVDWHLNAYFVNQSGRKLAADWNFGNREAAALNHNQVFQLPKPILSACRRLREQWGVRPAGSQTELAEVVRHRATGQLMTAEIVCVPPARGVVADPSFHIRLSSIPDDGKGGVLPERAPDTGSQDEGLLSSLSPAEREVVCLLSRGLSNKEIAESLHKSVHTVKRQISAVFSKLGLRSRAQLVALMRNSR